MGILETILTATTCGEACWSAREDVCRCSCRGANHGVLRGENGERPERSCKIQGHVYSLRAVCESYSEGERLAQEINQAAPAKHIGTSYTTHTYSGERGAWAHRKFASESQVERWPELSAYRNRGRAYNGHLIWVRADMPGQEAELPGTPDPEAPAPPAFGSTTRQPEGLNPPPLELRSPVSTQGQLL